MTWIAQANAALLPVVGCSGRCGHTAQQRLSNPKALKISAGPEGAHHHYEQAKCASKLSFKSLNQLAFLRKLVVNSKLRASEEKQKVIVEVHREEQLRESKHGKKEKVA